MLRYDDFADQGARDHRRQGRAGGLRLGRQRHIREFAEMPRAARHPRLVRRILRRSAAGLDARTLGNMGSLFVTHPSLIHYTATRADLLETANDLFAMVASGKIKIDDQPKLSA